jgi:CRP-like cAMP-binding protein
MIEAFLKKLRARDHLSDAEEAALRRAAGHVETFLPGATLVREDTRPIQSMLLVSGLCGRATTVADGGRQITAIHIDGDFVDLPSLIIRHMDHSIVALTHARVMSFPHDRLREITAEYPHLTRLLWLTTLIDSASHREWVVALGRRDAEARAARFFCELKARMDVVGLTEGLSFRLPINQQVLSDCLGLSAVHTNRVLQALRGRGLLEWTNGRVVLPDWDGLVELAEFDPTYLQINIEPR